MADASPATRLVASMTARWKSGGVEGILTMRKVPAAASNATRSVKVPPTSTPTRSRRSLVCSPASVGIESHPMSHFRAVATLLLSLCAACPGCNSRPSHGAAIDARQSIAYLASDQLEGRGPGSAGLDRAADYIAEQFQSIGLRKLPGQKSFFQRFEMTAAMELGPKTALRVGERPFTPHEDFVPLGMSGEGAFAGEVVFAGYGTASADHKYDDYAGLDAKGKVVLAMRYEPHDE